MTFESMRKTARTIYGWHFGRHTGDRRFAAGYLKRTVGYSDHRFGDFTEADAAMIRAEFSPMRETLDAKGLHDYIKTLYNNGCNGHSQCRCSACLLAELAQEIDDSDVFVYLFLNTSTGLQPWSFWCYPDHWLKRGSKDDGCVCPGCQRNRAAALHIKKYGGYNRQYPAEISPEQAYQLSLFGDVQNQDEGDDDDE